MKVKYRFADGDVSEVEVSEEIGVYIRDSRRSEGSEVRRHRRHCLSLDAMEYEGAEYGAENLTEHLFDDGGERDEQVRQALSRLSELQKKRLLLLAGGLSIREIARREGRNFCSVHASIETARKKIMNFLLK